MSVVYLMHITNIDSRLHKIGFAHDVERRRREISSEFGVNVLLIGSIDVDDDKFVERWFHELFGEYRVDGELFLLDESRIALWHALARVIERSRGKILTTRTPEEAGMELRE